MMSIFDSAIHRITQATEDVVEEVAVPVEAAQRLAEPLESEAEDAIANAAENAGDAAENAGDAAENAGDAAENAAEEARRLTEHAIREAERGAREAERAAREALAALGALVKPSLSDLRLSPREARLVRQIGDEVRRHGDNPQRAMREGGLRKHAEAFGRQFIARNQSHLASMGSRARRIDGNRQLKEALVTMARGVQRGALPSFAEALRVLTRAGLA